MGFYPPVDEPAKPVEPVEKPVDETVPDEVDSDEHDDGEAEPQGLEVV